MSFQAKDVLVLAQQLKVQELCFSQADSNMYIVDGADIIVPIREALQSVLLCVIKDDSVPSLVVKPAASVTIVDKDSPYGAGGDSQAIRIAAFTLAANDVVLLKYVVNEGA